MRFYSFCHYVIFSAIWSASVHYRLWRVLYSTVSVPPHMQLLERAHIRRVFLSTAMVLNLLWLAEIIHALETGKKYWPQCRTTAPWN
uniref:Uncharacterized protein n=1 Tax=Rhipicephalus zambeziensis TaxID=60191 RepID=A0A224YGM4_9ACAR